MKNRRTDGAVGGAGALTDASFWDGCYEGRELVPFSDSDWRNYVAIQLARLLNENITTNVQNVCELGGGMQQRFRIWPERIPIEVFRF